MTRALHMTGVVDREDDPTARELEDGMTVLQSLYAGWIAGGMFGRLEDVYKSGDYDALEGERVSVDDATITIPATIDDDGETRAPRELTAVAVITSTGEVLYLFVAGQWRRLDTLAETDEAPLSNRGANGLAACVAVAYAEEFGAPLGPGTYAQCRNFKTALSFKFGSTREPVAADWF